MPKYEFDHIHLTSQDPQKTADFYVKTFKAKIIKAGDLPGGRKMVSLTLNEVPVLITPPKGKVAEPTNVCKLEHFGFSTDNIEEAVAELKKKGINFTQEITVISPTAKIAFFNSPEGLVTELMEGSL